MKDKLKRSLWLGFIIITSVLLIINGILIETDSLINKIMILAAALSGIVLCFMIPYTIALNFKLVYDDSLDICNGLLQKIKHIFLFLRVGISIISVVFVLIFASQAFFEQEGVRHMIIGYSWFVPLFGSLMYYVPWIIFKIIQHTAISIIWLGLSCYEYISHGRFDVPVFVKIKSRYCDDEAITKVWLDEKLYNVIKRLDKN